MAQDFKDKDIIVPVSNNKKNSKKTSSACTSRNLVKKTNPLLSNLGLKSGNTLQTRRLHTKRSGKKKKKTVTFVQDEKRKKLQDAELN